LIRQGALSDSNKKKEELSNGETITKEEAYSSRARAFGSFKAPQIISFFLHQTF
jgi:hypothetical protein